MSALRAVWAFLVGDDPVVAAGVAVAIGATAVLAAVGIAAWWLLPVAVLVLLGVSVARAG